MAVLALALAACGPRPQAPVDEPRPGGGTVDPGHDSGWSAPDDRPWECRGGVEGELVVGERVAGTLSGPDQVYACPEAGSAPDAAWHFVAPIDATYTFAATGGALLVASSCEEALACGGVEPLALRLDEGDELWLVVDGGPGPYSLRVDADVELACGDGKDDDGDGVRDCRDPDCQWVRECALACTDAVLPIGVWTPSDGVPRNELDLSCASNDAARAFRFTPDVDGLWTFAFEGSGALEELAVLADCGGSEHFCGSTFPTVAVDLRAGVPVVVARVDSGTPRWSAYAIAVTASETACEDGVDEDVDGATDCVDPDCHGLETCIEICDNRRDDDDDSHWDCNDPDCWSDPAC